MMKLHCNGTLATTRRWWILNTARNVKSWKTSSSMILLVSIQSGYFHYANHWFPLLDVTLRTERLSQKSSKLTWLTWWDFTVKTYKIQFQLHDMCWLIRKYNIYHPWHSIGWKTRQVSNRHPPECSHRASLYVVQSISILSKRALHLL